MELLTSGRRKKRVVRISPRQCINAHYVHTRSSAARQALQLIRVHLFAEPLRIVDEMNDTEIPLTREFREFIDIEWMRFAMQVQDAFLVLGVVPITFYRDDQKRIVLTVPQLGTYYIDLVIEPDHSFHYTATPVSGGITQKPDPNIFVLHGFGQDPDVAGNITTGVGALARDVAFLTHLRDTISRATEARADPSLLLRRTNDKPRHELVEVAPPQPLDTFEPPPHIAVRSEHDDGVDAKHVLLPPDLAMEGARVTPDSPHNYSDMRRLIEEGVFSAYGVPRSTLIADHAVTGSADAKREAKQRTLENHRAVISHILTHTYNYLYGAEDCSYLFGDAKEPREPRCARVELVPRIESTQEELLSLYGLGVIEPELFVDLMRRRLGIPGPGNLADVCSRETALQFIKPRGSS